MLGGAVVEEGDDNVSETGGVNDVDDSGRTVSGGIDC